MKTVNGMFTKSTLCFLYPCCDGVEGNFQANPQKTKSMRFTTVLETLL